MTFNQCNGKAILNGVAFFCFMKFESIHTMLNKARKLSEVKAWKSALDRQTQQFIISLNTNEQLGEDGIDSKGRSLGDYAPFTVNFRRSKGLQVDHIDFKVTGDYWASWRITVKNDHFLIDVDQARFTELVNLLRFSDEHVGLTEESIGRLQIMLREKYYEFIRAELLPIN